MSAVVVTTPYTYLRCPECDQLIRFTNRTRNGLVEQDRAALVAGVRVHLLVACEAVAR